MTTPNPLEFDLATIREAAEKATPGPWVHMTSKDRLSPFEGEIRCSRDDSPHSFSLICNMPNGDDRWNDFEHIANMDPPTTLAMLDRIEALETELAQTKADGNAYIHEMAQKVKALTATVKHLLICIKDGIDPMTGKPEQEADREAT